MTTRFRELDIGQICMFFEERYVVAVKINETQAVDLLTQRVIEVHYNKKTDPPTTPPSGATLAYQGQTPLLVSPLNDRQWVGYYIVCTGTARVFETQITLPQAKEPEDMEQVNIILQRIVSTLKNAEMLTETARLLLNE